MKKGFTPPKKTPSVPTNQSSKKTGVENSAEQNNKVAEGNVTSTSINRNGN